MKSKRPPRPRPKRAQNLAALNPRNHSRDRRHLVDFDYVHKLNAEEKLWLSTFVDAWVRGDFRGDDASWPKDKRGSVNQSKNAGRTDVFTQGQLAPGGLASWPPPYEPACDNPRGLDLQETPAYLNNDLYKQARDAFRTTLHPGRKPKEPRQTQEHQRTKRRLEKLTPTGAPSGKAQKTKIENWPDDDDNE